MSQHDFNIANQGFPATRADLNNALAALASSSSGTSEPSTTYAGQMWNDTTNNLLKFRNDANDAWITFAKLDQATNEWEVRSSVFQAVDSAGIAFKTDEGTTRATLGDDGNFQFNSVDIEGGTIDDTTIGGGTPAAATFTTATATKISDGTDSVPTGYAVNGSAKAWVNFNGSGTPAARDSLNHSSLTDGGTGDYTLAYTSSFSNANYALLCSGASEFNHPRGPTFQIQLAIDGSSNATSKTTSQTQVYGGIGSTASSDGVSFDLTHNFAACLGDLA